MMLFDLLGTGAPPEQLLQLWNQGAEIPDEVWEGLTTQAEQLLLVCGHPLPLDTYLSLEPIERQAFAALLEQRKDEHNIAALRSALRGGSHGGV